MGYGAEAGPGDSGEVVVRSPMECQWTSFDTRLGSVDVACCYLLYTISGVGPTVDTTDIHGACIWTSDLRTVTILGPGW